MDFQDLPDEAALLAAHEELLALLLAEEGFDLAAQQSQKINRRRQADPPPLSFAQQRLWFLDQLEPGNTAYNFIITVRLTGRLDIAALERSLAEIVRRHEVLRTTFALVEGQPVQMIQPDLQVRLSILDLTDSSNIQDLIVEQTQQPFNLAQGPLLRPTLFRLGSAEHILVVTMHHIIFDGWSQDVFFAELGALYQAFSAGQSSPLPELPLQYADFAQWQREWLQGPILADQLAYWRQQLSDSPPVLELPTDRPRPTVQTFRGATQAIPLPPPLVEALRALGQSTGVTLFMTLLAAFKTLLYRYTGQTDILVGSPIANRNHAEIEDLIGFFVNTLVLRTNLADNPTCRELLERVREVALGAYAHQDLPFEQLVAERHPERDLGHQPLFQVMFALQKSWLALPALPDLSLSLLEIDSGVAQFELSLFVEENEQGLTGFWEYNTDLFNADTVVRMAGHFQTLLEGLVANPEQRLADLPLLTAAEKQQLLFAWNDTQADYPQDLLVHQRFEAQAAQTPDAIAIVGPPANADPDSPRLEQLTYTELNSRANQLAHHLQALGVGPETLVGLYLDRSVEMLIALLAVLKAGGAYLPLDPSYPQERLAFVLEDAQVARLLTQTHLCSTLPDLPTPLICLDKDWPAIARQPTHNPVSAVTGDNLAYLIYTSGSTGRPKGVQLPHRALTNFLYTMQREPGLTRRDILLAVTTMTFDITGLELFLPLMVGARIELVSRAVAADGLQLAHRLAESGATIMQATPATWRLLLAASWSGSPHLTILCGGEALPWTLAEQLLERSAVLWNLYGPTETTIWSTASKIEPGAGSVSLGRPIANTQVYVLDARYQPVPIGVAGELYIGGHGVARGYLKRPELTAERFMPDPFGGEAGARLYKTGDVVRFRADGQLEFLGRSDYQVKLRGYRIELEEIETALSRHPAVRQAVVVVQSAGAVLDDKRLVAYMVPDPQAAPSSSELRAHLAQTLPDYMLPSAFILLENLPLTSNGKVDRRALPALDLGRSDLKSSYAPPRDPVELQLTQIWEDILNVQPVGITDNFFDLGGHSLLAVRLMSQLRQRFKQDLPLATLFQGATIEHLATILRKQSGALPQSPLVGIRLVGTKSPFFCVHAVDGNVLGYVDLVRHLPPDQPFYGFQSRGLLGEQVAHTRIEPMAAYYIEALQTIQPQGPYFLGGWSMGGVVAFEMAQQLHQQGAEVALLALLDSWAPGSDQKLGAEEDDTKLLTEFLQHLRGRFAKDLPVLPDDLWQRSIEEQLSSTLTQARLLESIFPEADLQHIHWLLQVFKANLRAVSNYAPQIYPGRVVLFKSSELVSPEEAYPDTADPTWGWHKLSTQAVTIEPVPGDHYTMLTEPHAQTLAERLRVYLDRAKY